MLSSGSSLPARTIPDLSSSYPSRTTTSSVRRVSPAGTPSATSSSRSGPAVATLAFELSLPPPPTTRRVTRWPGADERTQAEATYRWPLRASAATSGRARPTRAGCGPRARTDAHDPEVRPWGSRLASARPTTCQPLRSCSKLQLTTRLPNALGPGGREVGPAGLVVASAAGPSGSLAELISQVASTPANTTEAMTTAMAAPAGPPNVCRCASWRPRTRSGCSGWSGGGSARCSGAETPSSASRGSDRSMMSSSTNAHLRLSPHSRTPANQAIQSKPIYAGNSAGLRMRPLTWSGPAGKEQADVPELVPQVPAVERRRVRPFQRLWGQEGPEQVEVAGLGLVQPGQQPVHHRQWEPGRDPEPGHPGPWPQERGSGVGTSFPSPAPGPFSPSPTSGAGGGLQGADHGGADGDDAAAGGPGGGHGGGGGLGDQVGLGGDEPPVGGPVAVGRQPGVQADGGQPDPPPAQVGQGLDGERPPGAGHLGPTRARPRTASGSGAAATPWARRRSAPAARPGAAPRPAAPRPRRRPARPGAAPPRAARARSPPARRRTPAAPPPPAAAPVAARRSAPAPGRGGQPAPPAPGPPT